MTIEELEHKLQEIDKNLTVSQQKNTFNDIYLFVRDATTDMKIYVGIIRLGRKTNPDPSFKLFKDFILEGVPGIEWFTKVIKVVEEFMADRPEYWQTFDPYC